MMLVMMIMAMMVAMVIVHFSVFHFLGFSFCLNCLGLFGIVGLQCGRQACIVASNAYHNAGQQSQTIPNNPKQYRNLKRSKNDHPKQSKTSKNTPQFQKSENSPESKEMHNHHRHHHRHYHHHHHRNIYIYIYVYVYIYIYYLFFCFCCVDDPLGILKNSTTHSHKKP